MQQEKLNSQIIGTRAYEIQIETRKCKREAAKKFSHEISLGKSGHGGGESWEQQTYGNRNIAYQLPLQISVAGQLKRQTEEMKDEIDTYIMAWI